MAQRPEYVDDSNGLPSLETWEEACVISQDWADGARLAASKRRKQRLWVTTVLAGAIVLAGWALVLLLIFDIRL
jgi:hypothetical protein